MNYAAIAQWLGLIAVPLSGFAVVLVNRRHRNKIEERDSTVAAAGAVADSAHDIVDVMTTMLAPLKAQIEAQQVQLDEQASALHEQSILLKKMNARTKEMTSVIRHLVSYARKLRGQLITLGHDPERFPEELEHLDLHIQE